MQTTSTEPQSVMVAEQHVNCFQFDNNFDFDDASHQWRLNKTYLGGGIFQYKQQAIPSSIVTRSQFSSSSKNRVRTCRKKNTTSTIACIKIRITRSKISLNKGNRRLFHEVEQMSKFTLSQRAKSTSSDNGNGINDTDIRITHSKMNLNKENIPMFSGVKERRKLLACIPNSTISVTSKLETDIYWIPPKGQLL